MDEIFKSWYKKQFNDEITPFKVNDIYFVGGSKYKVYKADTYKETVRQVRNMLITKVMDALYTSYEPMFKFGILQVNNQRMREYVVAEEMPGEETVDTDFKYDNEKYIVNKIL